MINAYQEFTRTTAIYPAAMSGNISALMYCALGLSGEAGEVAEKVKKYYRDGNLDVDMLSKEIGDVLWYIARLSDELGVSLEDILLNNKQKLLDRQQRDVLGGSGDER